MLKGLHCPTVTWSPSTTRNAGEQCAARFLCRFSYRAYLGMKWRYSRRMTMVRCILVETTVPVRIRPRIETRPVKGHFLSVVAARQLHTSSSNVDIRCVLHRPPLALATFPATYRCRSPQWPPWASGIPGRRSCTVPRLSQPSPASSWCCQGQPTHLRPFLPGRAVLSLVLELRKM